VNVLAYNGDVMDVLWRYYTNDIRVSAKGDRDIFNLWEETSTFVKKYK